LKRNASTRHDDVLTQSDGIDERLVAGRVPAGDQVPHDRLTGRLVIVRQQMNVRRGVVSRALTFGVRRQDLRETAGFADTDRDPAIPGNVAPGENIDPCRFANLTFEWLSDEIVQGQQVGARLVRNSDSKRQPLPDFSTRSAPYRVISGRIARAHIALKQQSWEMFQK
jgi:hypothetical protein